mmetsp:Transcript_4267/g.9663  ORF Transcript_4267/g.9663 Transcript_4267/m.9663 type:complete len:242 (+) Transcript_4267:845-1570(+)
MIDVARRRFKEMHVCIECAAVVWMEKARVPLEAFIVMPVKKVDLFLERWARPWRRRKPFREARGATLGRARDHKVGQRLHSPAPHDWQRDAARSADFLPLGRVHRRADRVARGTWHHAREPEPDARCEARVRAHRGKQRRVSDDLHLTLTAAHELRVRVVHSLLQHVAPLVVAPSPIRIEGLVREEQQRARPPRLHDDLLWWRGEYLCEKAQVLEVGDAKTGRARLDGVAKAIAQYSDVAI